MRNLRSILGIAAFIFLFTLIGHFQFALAAPPTHYHIRLTNATIPWGFPAGEFCPAFPQPMLVETVPLSSDRVKNVSESVLPNGDKRVAITDLIRGAATDEFGGSYTYIYENNATFTFDGSAIHVSMKDTFRLNGPTSYTVGFNWRWSFPADSLGVDLIYDDDGRLVDAQATPNLPPTEDGLVEAPFIVPGSWQQLSTRGDPWNCDPL